MGVDLTPSQSICEYQAGLEGLDDAAQDIQGELVIADFNAKARDWEEARSSSRARLVADMASRIDLVVLNQGTTTTYRRLGYRETIIDIFLASQHPAAQIEDWQVIEDYTGSDHIYITFRVRDGRPAPIPRKRTSPRWNIDKMNPERLFSAIAHG